MYYSQNTDKKSDASTPPQYRATRTNRNDAMSQTQRLTNLLAGKSLLIVDDNKDLCKSLAMLLEGSGAHVQAAHDAERARQVFNEDSFDLIILDIMLDGEDGFDLFVYLRRKLGNTETPVLFLSALYEPKHSRLLNGSNQGNARVLSKSEINTRLSTELKLLLEQQSYREN